MNRLILSLCGVACLAACSDPTDVSFTPVVAPPAHNLTGQGWPITDLGTLPGGSRSIAFDLNAAGVAVGVSDNGVGDHATL
jgi:hypothetical protein